MSNKVTTSLSPKHLNMPKYQIEWKAELSNVTDLRPLNEDFEWSFKVMCTKCHEVSEKPVTFKSTDQIEIPNSRGVSNFVMKCKWCNSLGTMDIEEKTLQPYLAESVGFQPLVVIEGRGWEPVEWLPLGKFGCSGQNSSTIFGDIPLDDDWCDYDEKAGESVEIMNLKSQISKYK